MDRVPHTPCHLKNVSFGIYRTSEIIRLSVQEISNPDIFDELGNPLPNGLYDSHLGSINEEDTCDTCGLNGHFCPGHFGHMVLPLPVFNPVLIKPLCQLLQTTCFDCHHIRANHFDIKLLLCQLQALDFGLIELVDELSVIHRKSKIANDSIDIFEKKLQCLIGEATEGINVEFCKSRACAKSIVECQQRITKAFLKTLVTNSAQVCPSCHKKSSKIVKNSEDLCGKYHFLFFKNDSKENANNTSLGSPSEESDNQSSNILFTPEGIKGHLNLVWANDSTLLKHLFGCLSTARSTPDCLTDIFFIEMLIVPPSRFRPMSVIEDQKYLNTQTDALKNVLTDIWLMENLKNSIINEIIPETAKVKFHYISGRTYQEKFNHLWHQLQVHVNYIYDSDMGKFNKDRTFSGVKQILEKKEGLLRKHMMGKRVNFAARTVISPNPYLSFDEVGIPELFAKKLTYPTRVTNYNARKLRRAVRNGPDFHPGANKIETEGGKIINLSGMDPFWRRNYARKWLTKDYCIKGSRDKPIIIHRHLRNGDMVLLNRQPTLHKPSIMAHKVKVLPGAGKTFQLPYANCKAYNADFDGDEMNLHFPQSELGRSEALCVLNVSQQYLGPKDGSPLSGLIQDHIVSGTMLTMRGRFFSRGEYQQLVYDAVAFLNKPVKTLPPAMLKPYKLWSGKQVISTIVINVIPEGLPLPTIDEGRAHIASKNWQNAPARKWKAGGTPLVNDDMTELEVIIRSGELLCGVMDKANIGATPYGLIHCCFELYGGETSTALLTSFSRLFTNFLQIHSGFTLNIDDVCLTKKADKEKRMAMRTVNKNIDKVIAHTLDVDDPKNKAEATRKFKEAHKSKDDSMLKTLHFEQRKFADDYTEMKNQICMHHGLLKKFPKNNFQLMVKSGSKGSFVNAMQISSGLGQIELEGCGVPLMLNGNTLPSYLPYDTSPKAGGFVDGCFLTGLCSQEFFFHCMAGREGLVDTAVKTSDSGYLQRSLIKHLEGLMINYDQTVRDSDGNVIQFLYGEDGLDITKMQLLKKGKLHLLANNYAAAENEAEVEFLKAQQVLPISDRTITHSSIKPINHHSKHPICLPKEDKDIVYERIVTSVLKQDLCHLYFDTKKSTSDSHKRTIDPINTMFQPGSTFGSISEKLDNIIEDYIKTYYVKNICDENDSSKIEKFKDAVNFLDLCYHRALKSAVPPGEAVGLLAAQSIGEPSTQMTLNTFHLAGLNDTNVTLGIPRLMEILMHASISIKTPTMNVPLLNKPGAEKEAKELCLKLSPVYLNQVLKSIDIEETLHLGKSSHGLRKYSVKMTFLQSDDYKDVLYTSQSHILQYIENCFIPNIVDIAKSSSSKKSYRKKKHISKNYLSVNEETDYDDDDETMCSILTNESLDYELDKSVDREEMGTAEACGEKGETNELIDDDFSFEPNQLRSSVEKRKRRESIVVDKCNWVSSYTYGPRHKCTCEFELQIPLEVEKFILKTIIENEANSAKLNHVPNIKKAFLIENLNSRNKEIMLKTEGVNFSEIFMYGNIIDTTKIYSNDIHAIANTLGIEAATRVIVKEITSVFTTYGITVDLRHLLLVADYMTSDGTIKAFNRYGIQSNASPLQKMSFETTMNFLENAIVAGTEDQLKSPSAKIIVGQPIAMGTACFEVL